jgi:hypothetical protein
VKKIVSSEMLLRRCLDAKPYTILVYQVNHDKFYQPFKPRSEQSKIACEKPFKDFRLKNLHVVYNFVCITKLCSRHEYTRKQTRRSRLYAIQKLEKPNAKSALENFPMLLGSSFAKRFKAITTGAMLSCVTVSSSSNSSSVNSSATLPSDRSTFT